MRYGFDASTPPEKAPPKTAVACGYIGGETPHVWTNTEWARFDGMKKLPIYVSALAVGKPGDARTEAFDALRAMYNLKVPKGSPIVWDMETAVNDTYLKQVQSIVNWYGYKLWPYGSMDAIMHSTPCDGRFVADWNYDKPALAPGRYVVATQWKSDTGYDLDVFRWIAYQFFLKTW